MASALLGDPSERLVGVIAGDGLAPDARLAIYRHHVFTTLTAALQAVYPVVCRLVHERFFAFAAHEFVRHHPPAGPCLFEYGRQFPAFLAGFPPCRALGYLPDVARLEWALNAALHAADAVPLDLARLRQLDADQSERVIFEFQPSVALVTSPYPVDQIWRANRLPARAVGRPAPRRRSGGRNGRGCRVRSGPGLAGALGRAGTDRVHDLVVARGSKGMRSKSHLVAWFELLERVPFSIHQLLFRLAIAGVFMRAGLTKIASWEPTVALFREEYKVPILPPEVAATVSASFELVCSTLLIVGLATRVATLPLLGMITTIQLFVYPQAWPEHLVWSSILLVLLTRGGGAFSLDQLIRNSAAAKAHSVRV